MDLRLYRHGPCHNRRPAPARAGLVAHVTALGSDIVVLEIADGVFQQETANLLQSPEFRRHIDGIIFAAGDALGAVGGVNWLKSHNLPVLALSGLLTTSPLAMREAAVHVDTPIALLNELMTPHFATRLCFGAGQDRVPPSA